MLHILLLMDFFNSYWQFLLEDSCQEVLSFLTDVGVFTPTSFLMGRMDSVVSTVKPLSKKCLQILLV